jgi:STE24 endopeptidase
MNESKATRYQRLRRRAEGASVGAGALLLVVLTVTSGARSLATWADAKTAAVPAALRALAALLLFVACISCLWEAVALPAVLYLGLHVERRFRRAEHTVIRLVAAHLQSAVVGVAVAIGGSIAVWVSWRVAGEWWWIVAALLIAVGLVAALRAVPLLLPLAGELRPLARARVSARISALANRAGVPILGVYEWRTGDAGDATALVTGLGRTRRAVVSEALTRDWSDDEVEVMLAHELAHHVHHDLSRMLTLDALVLSLGLLAGDVMIRARASPLGLSGPGDPAALPILALVVGFVWLLAIPVRLAQSRLHERRADRFALAATGRIDAFSTAVRRLGARHLAEERPSRLTRWWYHRHPVIEERLALAERHRAAR